MDLPDMKTAALDARNASEDRLKSDGAPGKLSHEKHLEHMV